ncbi:CpaD family pilus assembly protein [Enterovirga aerilata]|uniref:CpaD family pilus assembly protein n=1 Tax=Enterovirga aerilata TaxID=2730920 RepID=UPI001FED58A4|nr:CpaD family pilus assembly protein [Enterovirga sp. DB1703]
MAQTGKFGRRIGALAAFGAISAALAGCHTAGEVTGSTYPVDLRDRHPIVLANGPRVLDVFVDAPRGVSERERADLAAFLAEYRRYGQGPLLAQVPKGVRNAAATRAAVERIRATAGVRIALSTYEPADPALASPIRLSFTRLQAKVGSTCGLWPQDLGVADPEFSMANQPYWNLGCATQSNFAAQVADPVDLVRGRQPTAPDTGRRMYNIEKLRQGQDPSTNYRTDERTVRQGVSE